MTDPLGLVRVFAPAKINLLLQVFEKGPDGLHRLRSLVTALALGDDVVVRPRPGPLEVRYVGADIEPAEDLVRKAASIWGLSGDGCEVTVHKRIPLQAGLGGGSSDAVAGVMALSEAAGVALGDDGGRWSSIGSDVPFFAVRRPGVALIEGTGGITAFEDVLPPAWGVVLLQPDLRIATAEAYARLDAARARDGQIPHDDGGIAARQFLNAWRARNFTAACAALHNDFSSTLDDWYDAIDEARTRLLAAGAAATVLCGSGSCVAGFCPDERSAEGAFANLSLCAGEWAATTSFWRGDG